MNTRSVALTTAGGGGMGAEQIIYGEFRSLGLSPFSYDRFTSGERVIERAVI